MEKPAMRKIYLSQQFTQDTAKTLISSIIDINDKDTQTEKELELNFGVKNYERKPIEIYIDSYGGTVYQAFGIISVMEKSVTPVHTIVTGCAMSCGFMLAISGHKRFAYEHSTLLYHQVSSGGWDTLKGLEERLEETQRLQKKIKSLVLEKTKITKQRLKECFEKKIDWFITPEESLKLGIIDEIL